MEAQRLKTRTDYDIEMLTEMGYCSGIENYSRHLSGRAPGEPPPTALVVVRGVNPDCSANAGWSTVGVMGTPCIGARATT